MWNLERFKNRTAFITEKEIFKYYDIIKFSKKIEKKIKTKKLILVLAENSISCLLGYVSFFINRHAIILINSNIDYKSLNKIINNYLPDYIWLDNKKLFDKSKYKETFQFRSYHLFENKVKGNLPVNQNISLLVSTSGTTGSPKLIKQTYKNILANTNSILKYLPINKDDTTITNLPLNYTYGISIINTHLKVGSSIVLTNYSIFQKNFWKLFNLYKVSVINGVPYTYDILSKLKFFNNKNLFLRIITQAGGKLSNKLQVKINNYCSKYKKKFYIMYGQAEATTRISYLEYNKNNIKLGSVGKAVYRGKIILKNRNGKIINKANKIGDIYYSGPNVCEGYSLNRFDLNKKGTWNGTIKTGDIGKKDNQGYLYITGRSKRIAKIFGHSISLDDIEEKIKSEFNTNDVAVTGDNKYIYIFYEKNLNSKLVIKYLNRKINISKQIFLLKKLKRIPKLLSGKTNYNKIQKLYF